MKNVCPNYPRLKEGGIPFNPNPRLRVMAPIVSPFKLTHGGKMRPKGANNGSDHYKSIMGRGGNTCAGIEWSSPSSSYYTYMMAWKPKVGPRDDDFLSTTTRKDRRRSDDPFPS
jgi:hypothetical protein